MTARQPRAMNIAVIPKSHSQGVLDAGHDKLTTSYPLWTLDNETVTRLAAQADDDDNADSADGATVPTEPIVSASSSPPATRGRCLCFTAIWCTHRRRTKPRTRARLSI
jgi:hypothetical protein